MPQQLEWMKKIDFGESNWLSALFHFLSAVFACCSLLSNEWIEINGPVVNSTSLDEAPQLIFDLTSHTDKCLTLGCRDFWRPVRFGGFLDEEGQTHIAFHANDRVLVDCVTPVVANMFYVLIALCFVIALTSLISCFMNILPPVHPFLQWLKRNTILEMCNMVLTLFCCVIAIFAQSAVDSLRPEEEVSLGSGVFFVCFSGLFSFSAAAAQLRHITRMNRIRRIDNQRLLCARSLRSWRDAARRSEDTLPIVDFERYLDSATTMNELNPSQLQTA